METRQVRRGGCQNNDTFRDFNFTEPQLISREYRPLLEP